LAGGLLGIAFPPVSLPWALWFAFPLLWGLSERPRPYKHLYLALLIWNLLGCYWLMLTALSAPNLSEAIISLLAGAAAITVNPLLMLIPFALWRWMQSRWHSTSAFHSPDTVWLFVPLWGIFEYLHFRWELSWSWLNLGFAWSEWLYWRKMAGFLGVLGLSVWSLIGAVLLHTQRYALFVIWGFGVPGVAYFGSASTEGGSSRAVYAIQPNIDPYAKFSEFPPAAQIARLLSLLPPSPPQGALIVLPETAIPVGVRIDEWRTDPALQPFLEYTRRHGVNLLVGVVGYRYFSPGQPLSVSARPTPEGGGYEAYNAALLLRPDTIQVHIKARLVPFVERAPYLEVLSFLKKWQIDLGGGFGHFGKPDHQAALTLYPDEVPVVVAICYESIFMHDLRARLPERAGFLAILTNDGWWKRSSGYWQHLVYGTLTSTALGIPAVRSANTGVSAFFSPEGILLQCLGYEKQGRIEGMLIPQKPATLYYRFGEAGWFGLNTFALIVWWIRRYRSQRSSTPSEK